VREPRPASFWLLGGVFAAFVLFLYGPMLTIFVLSFQGPEGGLTFPMRGWSLHWFQQLWEGLGVVDIGAALRRSLALGSVVMVCTVRSRCWPGWPSARSCRAARRCSMSPWPA
jgi:putative spermidine/putrescine transport system permease protein